MEACCACGIHALPPSWPKGTAAAARPKSACILKPLTVHPPPTLPLSAFRPPDYVIAFLAHVENWQAILPKNAGAISHASEIAPIRKTSPAGSKQPNLALRAGAPGSSARSAGGDCRSCRKIEQPKLEPSLRIWIPDKETRRKYLHTEIPTNLPTNQKLISLKYLKNNGIKFLMERFARSRNRPR